MEDIELRFPSLKVLISFKRQSQIKELRIDTFEKTLTGKFPEAEITTATRVFQATLPHPQLTTVRSLQTTSC